jgi:hypothetical protein
MQLDELNIIDFLFYTATSLFKVEKLPCVKGTIVLKMRELKFTNNRTLSSLKQKNRINYIFIKQICVFICYIYSS